MTVRKSEKILMWKTLYASRSVGSFLCLPNSAFQALKISYFENTRTYVRIAENVLTKIRYARRYKERSRLLITAPFEKSTKRIGIGGPVD